MLQHHVGDVITLVILCHWVDAVVLAALLFALG
jgi:hypothetical protein